MKKIHAWTLLTALWLSIAALPAPAQRRTLPRALVADFANVSRDRSAMTARIASDTVAMELTTCDIYSVLARQEVERAAKRIGLAAPYSHDDLLALAKELEVDYLVTGEIRHVDARTRDGKHQLEVGLIVRVYAVALGEMINGAAERGIASNAPGGRKSDGELLMDAAISAAVRAVSRLRDYRPIEGTILNSQGRDVVILNRGLGHGVRKRQEFLVFRDRVRVGRLRVLKVFPSYAELTVVESAGGIRPEDQALAVFPEPKFE